MVKRGVGKEEEMTDKKLKVQCPTCGANTRTLEVRTSTGGLKRRRYECQNKHRFTTMGTAQDLRYPNNSQYKTEQTIVKSMGPTTRRINASPGTSSLSAVLATWTEKTH